MVYLHAARKTGAYLVLAAMLSFAIVTFLSGDVQPTARVVDAGPTGLSTETWILFSLGIFTGALLIGTYVYLAHVEGRRHE